MSQAGDRAGGGAPAGSGAEAWSIGLKRQMLDRAAAGVGRGPPHVRYAGGAASQGERTRTRSAAPPAAAPAAAAAPLCIVRAVYRLSRPAPALAPYIEHYWHVSARRGAPFELSLDVHVDLRPDLVFNFGVPYTRSVAGGEARQIGSSNLDAQRLSPIRIVQRGEVVIVGVRLFTGGLAPFVSSPLSAWTDRVAPIEEVFGGGGLALDRTLREAAGDDAAQARALDAFFLERLALAPSVRLVHAVKSRIEEEGGQSRIEALCEVGETSPRNLDRLFRRHLGVGPKTFCRVVRFQRALARLRRAPGCSLAAVAAECGYYDQPHFVREFRRLTGAVPSERVGFFPEDAPVDFSPNYVRFVQDGPQE